MELSTYIPIHSAIRFHNLLLKTLHRDPDTSIDGERFLKELIKFTIPFDEIQKHYWSTCGSLTEGSDDFTLLENCYYLAKDLWHDVQRLVLVLTQTEAPLFPGQGFPPSLRNLQRIVPPWLLVDVKKNVTRLQAIRERQTDRYVHEYPV